jgi:Phage protein Gp138 N-terminal domain
MTDGQRNEAGEPSFDRMMLDAIMAGVAKVHTQLPGIVVDYDGSANTATIQPAVHIDGNPWAPIPDVEIEWPGWGDFQIVGELVKGDEVVLSFHELDFGRFIRTGEVSQAEMMRRAGLYATARPTKLSDPKRNLVVGESGKTRMGIAGGPEIVWDGTNVLVGGIDATSFIALADLVVAELNTLKSAINSAPTTPNDGGASFKAGILAALSAWPGNVAATVAKGK